MDDGIIVPLKSEAIMAARDRASVGTLGFSFFARAPPPLPCMVWGEEGLKGKGLLPPVLARRVVQSKTCLHLTTIHGQLFWLAPWF